MHATALRWACAHASVLCCTHAAAAAAVLQDLLLFSIRELAALEGLMASIELPADQAVELHEGVTSKLLEVIHALQQQAAQQAVRARRAARSQLHPAACM